MAPDMDPRHGLLRIHSWQVADKTYTAWVLWDNDTAAEVWRSPTETEGDLAEFLRHLQTVVVEHVSDQPFSAE